MHDEDMSQNRLAEMVSRGFAENAERLDSLAQMVVYVEGKITAVYNQVAVLDERTTGLDEKITALDGTIEREISGLASIAKAGFDDLHERIDGIDARQMSFQNRLDTFLDHDRRLRRLERELGFPTVD